MRAYLCDPKTKTVVEIDYDGTTEMICELLGQPVENIDCFRMNDDSDYDESLNDEREYYCLYFAKPAGVDPEKDEPWFFGNFDCGRPSWDVGIVGKMLLLGSTGEAAGAPPHSSTMSLDQAKGYCAFTREDDFVTIPMGNAVVLVGQGAPDEVRAMAAEHNARPEARETMERMQEAGLGEMSLKPWH